MQTFVLFFFSDLIKSKRLTGTCHVSLMWEFKPVRMKLNKRAELCDRNTSELKRFPSDGASADSHDVQIVKCRLTLMV